MKNIEKAQEICEKNKRFKVECSSLECYLSALEMAEWKEKQMIEKACKWLDDNITNDPTRGLNTKYGRSITHGELLQEFKKAMEE